MYLQQPVNKAVLYPLHKLFLKSGAASVLAQRYGLSARRVQQILAEVKKKEVCDVYGRSADRPYNIIRALNGGHILHLI